MKRNLQVLVTHRGSPVSGKNGHPLSIADVVADLLETIPGGDFRQQMKLARTILQGDPVEITAEDITLIKNLASGRLAPFVEEQIVNLLEETPLE